MKGNGCIVYMKTNVAIEGRSEEAAVSTFERETGGFMTEAFVVLLNLLKKN
jgi:hypothetical protein